MFWPFLTPRFVQAALVVRVASVVKVDLATKVVMAVKVDLAVKVETVAKVEMVDRVEEEIVKGGKGAPMGKAVRVASGFRVPLYW